MEEMIRALVSDVDLDWSVEAPQRLDSITGTVKESKLLQGDVYAVVLSLFHTGGSPGPLLKTAEEVKTKIKQLVCFEFKGQTLLVSEQFSDGSRTYHLSMRLTYEDYEWRKK